MLLKSLILPTFAVVSNANDMVFNAGLWSKKYSDVIGWKIDELHDGTTDEVIKDKYVEPWVNPCAGVLCSP